MMRGHDASDLERIGYITGNREMQLLGEKLMAEQDLQYANDLVYEPMFTPSGAPAQQRICCTCKTESNCDD